MTCPRCGGPLDTYALREREAANCLQCGWVGIGASFVTESDADSRESWDDALNRVTERRVTTARTEGIDVEIEAEADTEVGTEIETRVETEVDDTGLEDDQTAEDNDSVDEEAATRGLELTEIDNIESTDEEQLQAVEIRTVEELAGANPIVLAEQTSLSESKLREYVRRASICIATRDT